MTEKLKMKTADMASENFEKLKALFPNCVTESLDKDGNPVRAIDKDLLMQEINSEVVEGQKERYQFNWPGKRDAIRKANAPTTMTLRPCKEESVDFDNTQNLYIEGDNLEVLKLLQNNYLGKVKMIYIDPPYNTGNDFVYNDNFKQDSETFLETSGMFDEDGNMTLQNFEKNSESNGRFHTDWLNMMYPRLKVARNLLKDDGIIFISIGQEEIANLTKITSEIFGSENKIGTVSRVTKTASNNGTFFAPTIDYILCFAKNIDNITSFVDDVDDSLYKKTETSGPRKGEKYRDDVALYQSALNDLRPNQKYFIECPDGSKVIPPCSILDEVMREGDGRWRWSKEKYLKSKDLLVFKETKSSPLLDENGNKARYNIYTKSYLSERQQTGTLPRELWENFINRKGADYLKKLSIPFDFSKPHELIEYMMKISSSKEDDIIVDFFSGSATTAEAVLRTNVLQPGRRRYIMVQLPELCDEKSEAFKAGYSTICEIGKERIRRCGKKIKDEFGFTAQNLDIGFRVLKLGDSNMNDVYYKPADIDQNFLDKLDTNIKRDRTPMDLLFQVMLECDLELSSKIEEREINGKKVFFVNDKELVACFDENIDEATITEIAKLKPYYFVMRDSSLATDNVADNFEQLWNAYSKDTIRKVL